jgi:predicted phage terminase large subunit-like protein
LSSQNNNVAEAAAELLARRKGRSSFADFCRYVAPDEPPAKHHELICDIADRIVSGECNRAIIMMPPGSAKSTYATVRFPAYFLGKMGKKGVICASYNDTLASLFGKRTRNLIKQEETQRLFPGLELQADSQAKGEWETKEGGFYFSVGIGGGVTGRRGDLGIIDDPIRGRKDADSETVRENCWQWYIDDFRTRLKPGASIILIQTRWHEDDLAGRILGESWDGESGKVVARDGEVWEVLCLPAQARDHDPLGRSVGEWLWQEWFSVDWWEQTKQTVLDSSSRSWNSLYQQVPSEIEGGFFQRSWFKRFHLGEEPLTNNYQSTDFATRDGAGDFTELGVFGIDQNEDIYAIDWWYGKTTTDVWIDAQLDQYEKFRCYAAFGEHGPIRRAVEPFLNMRINQREIYPRLEWLSRAGDKASMARSFQGLASAGKVYIPYTDWGERLIDQLCKFPGGRHDDAVDVCALMAMAIMDTHPAIIKTSGLESRPRDTWGRIKTRGGGSWKTN